MCASTHSATRLQTALSKRIVFLLHLLRIRYECLAPSVGFVHRQIVVASNPQLKQHRFSSDNHKHTCRQESEACEHMAMTVSTRQNPRPECTAELDQNLVCKSAMVCLFQTSICREITWAGMHLSRYGIVQNRTFGSDPPACNKTSPGGSLETGHANNNSNNNMTNL